MCNVFLNQKNKTDYWIIITMRHNLRRNKDICTHAHMQRNSMKINQMKAMCAESLQGNLTTVVISVADFT